VSHATADDLVRLGVVQDERRLIVVPPGMDLDPLLAVHGRSAVLRPLIGAGERDVVVGIIGRLAEVKRPELALEVLELLHQRYPQLHMVWVGDGDQRGLLERRIAALSPTLQARAHMLGARTDMPAVLADLDAVMLVSRSEGAPVALIEAAAAAKPVLATNVGGVSEVVAHERTGWLGNDMTELAFGLSQWLDTPQLLTATGQRARLRVQARHSAQHLADRLLEIYRIVVKERTCAS
jgi:glycosyltransferase involved in cell wall biosynthesis